MLVQIAWAVLGVIIIGGALLAHRSHTAYRAAIGALALLFLPAGAAAHAWNLATGVTYSGFADWSWSPFVTDTWESLVVPHDWVFIGLLVVFEATVGVLVLVPGRPRRKLRRTRAWMQSVDHPLFARTMLESALSTSWQCSRACSRTS